MRSLSSRAGAMLLGLTLAAMPAFAGSDAKVADAKVADAKKADTKKAATDAKMATKTDPTQDAMMAEMMKLGSPGPQHQKLQGMAGKWKAVTKSWMAPGDPTVTEGECDYAVVLGGRFVQQNMKGNFMGMPFEGMGLTGYDNVQKTYTFFWVDNFGTTMMTGTGNMNEAGNELVMNSTTPGPDGKPMQVKMVTKLVDPTKHVFSMYGVQDGKDQLMMETTYTKM